MGPNRPAAWWRRAEFPTWAVAAAVYGGFGLVTWHWQSLPWWLLLPLAGALVCWHGSLQHECLHGHPTRSTWVNRLVAGPPLGLWLPYDHYRASHIAHHATASLTDPAQDPESFYLDEDAWAARGRLARAGLWAHNTLVGRMLLGPPLQLWRFAVGQAGPRAFWAWHTAGLVAIGAWLVACGVPLGEYLLLAVWPGMALTLVRSYAEHRPTPAGGETATVVRAGPLALLFLNNHLHAAHHARPDAPWYALPRLAERERGYVIPSYLALFRRYGLRPKDSPCYPAAITGRTTT